MLQVVAVMMGHNDRRETLLQQMTQLPPETVFCGCWEDAGEDREAHIRSIVDTVNRHIDSGESDTVVLGCRSRDFEDVWGRLHSKNICRVEAGNIEKLLLEWL